MSVPAIRVQGIGKRYRIGERAGLLNNLTKAFAARNGAADQTQTDSTFWALRDVSLEIGKGEVVGLIGPNGAGKSTLLKILSRITEPTYGSIDLYGRVSSILEVGTGFHKELSGRENVYLNGSILGLKKREIDRKFDEIVAFAEMEQYINTMVKFYSTGMTVRLAFAVAAHLDPDILLVDEVLAVGDAAFQKKSLDKMESVGQEGRTIIFVSHQLSSITRLCERVILLNHGRLIKDGPTDEVVASYLTSQTGMGAIKQWSDPATMPGDPVIRLCSVRVVDEQGQTNYSFDIRRPVGVEMTYEVLQPGSVLYPSFSIHNRRDISLFTALDTDAAWHGSQRPVGRYTSTAWIPGNLLAEGDFKVLVSMHSEKPHRAHFQDVEAAAFQVIESPDGDTARVDYTGQIKGVVRPYMNWNTRFSPNSP